jgi:hypothetical protein
MKLTNKLREIKNRFIKNKLPKACYKSLFMSSQYYFIFDESFYREFTAILAGKVKHLQEMEKRKSNYYLLVRNTRGIEKELMHPSRDLFGKNYIKERLIVLKEYGMEVNERNPQMKWFYDVLTEYFKNLLNGFIDTQYCREKGFIPK